MYYLVDLRTNKRFSFISKHALLFAWRNMTAPYRNWNRNIPPAALTFEKLNVTGHDTVRERQLVPGEYIFISGLRALPVYETVSILRRYMVFDDAGRSIDIRTWTKEIEDVNGSHYNRWDKKKNKAHKPKFRQEPCDCGRKNHGNRMHTPAFWKESLQASLIIEDEDLPVNCDALSLCNNLKTRHRGIGLLDGWDVAERKYRNKYRSSKSWKDQTRAGKQWAKHKIGCSKSVMRKTRTTPENEELSFEDMMGDWNPDF